MDKQKIGSCLANKSIVLVGNSAGLLKQNQGDLIDGHDIVVRFNLGVPSNPEYHKNVGTKTNIWVCAINNLNIQKVKWELFTTKPEYVLRFNNDNIHPDIPFEIYPSLDYEIFRTLNGFIGERYPSTGIMCLYFLLKDLKLPRVTVVGFDGFTTKYNYYNEPEKNNADIVSRFHDQQFEINYVKKLVDEGKVFRA